MKRKHSVKAVKKKIVHHMKMVYDLGYNKGLEAIRKKKAAHRKHHKKKR